MILLRKGQKAYDAGGKKCRVPRDQGGCVLTEQDGLTAVRADDGYVYILEEVAPSPAPTPTAKERRAPRQPSPRVPTARAAPSLDLAAAGIRDWGAEVRRLAVYGCVGWTVASLFWLLVVR